MDPACIRRRLPAALAFAAALAAGLAVASRELGSLGGDNAEYVLLAKSLAGFDGYVSRWAPGPDAPHVLYPPLFPLLLAPFCGAAPASFLACHLVPALSGAVAVLFIALLFERRGLPPWAAAAAALAPALSFHWLADAADVLSDLPCLAFVAAALYALEPGQEERLPRRRVVAAVVLAALAFYTRTAALSLAIPVAAALLCGRRTEVRHGRIAAVALLGVCGLWFLRGALLGSGGYLGQVDAGGAGSAGLLGRAWSAFRGLYFPGTPAFLFLRPGAPWNWAGVVLWVLGGTAVLEGIFRRRSFAVAEATFLATLALHCAWPHRDPRFALPTAALLAPVAIEQIHRFAAASDRARSAAAAVAISCAALLLAPNVERLFGLVLPRAHRARPAAAPGLHEPSRFAHTWGWSDAQYVQAAPALASFLHACDVVRDGGLPGVPAADAGPVMATNPRLAALLCERRAVQPPAGAGPDAVAALVREKGVALVLVDDFAGGTSDSLRAYARERAADLEPLATLPGNVALLRVRR
jgi:hypothetical protein